MNYAIANITDEYVTKGQIYPVLSMHDGMVNIDVNGKMICFNAEDKDFTIHLNEESSATKGKYVCFIELFDEGSYNYIEGVNSEGGFALCVDFENYAKHFDTTDEAIFWAYSQGLKDGEFGVRCYWIKEN